MKKRKGFTMVEAVIAMALLSAMTAIFVAGIMHSYSFLMKMKGLTSDAYGTMQSVEREAQAIRDELESATPNLSGYTARSYQVFGKTVNAYEVSKSGDYGLIWTLVGENSYATFEVPSIAVSATFNNGNFLKASYLNSTLKAESEEILAEENKSLYLTTTYRWYVSNEGYYIRSNDASDYLRGGDFPEFPNDFQAIGGTAGKSADYAVRSDDYLGKHLVLLATPVATSGKMGLEVVSNYLYVSGLPVTGSNLKMHLDASLIELEDYDNYNSGDGQVNRWTDFSGNGYHGTVMPSGVTVENNKINFNGKFANAIEYTGSEVMGIESNIGMMQECTMFVVVKGGSGNVSSPFITTSNCMFSLDRFVVGSSLLNIDGVTAGDWYILGINVDKSGGAATISATVDDGSAQQIPMAGPVQEIDFQNMTIGANGISMAEVILYDESLDPADYNDVLNYLLKKYK